MKKFLALFLVVVLCFSLCACANDKTEYPVGSVVTTSVVEFSLSRFEYAEKLKNATFQTGKTNTCYQQKKTNITILLWQMTERL